ncbi:serine/threonine protein kinase [Herbiconiux moechotypicola]|uniref:non-specific serine/threonine protein kinase n=1 Tax=Herbiconiux moechotypicola TaxID=637393 RepID=A0ABN3DCF5_9MICO|nr:serine/threonine-protein kinase [Herbiconiux moechotypicola]MCS5728732.1 serine/threonine protein kinase [Herbiconiux moechotypicola]
MNARRPPSSPPSIPGFDYVELLGSGGFADVFLYEQRLPRRRVAIKVLLSESLTPGARESFDAEANLMAQLSTHPSIVTIYQAGIADDGRPYLAMEYCPKPNLGARYRRERIGVAEALRIGVQVAGAVETSHRAGILHRDIKPANILVTEYNRPALTDFGISVALVGGGAEQESVGMSIPWSPPEVFAADPSSGAPADIYSLGATVYTLLAGRSPFEVPGGANSGLDLIARIQTARLLPTGRADVPPSLEQVLATAMAPAEAGRYDSALEFARALQKVQLELSMAVTPVDVLDEHVPEARDDEEDEGSTRVRGIVTIDPTGPSRPTAGAPGHTQTRPGTPPAPASAPSSPHSPSSPSSPSPATLPPTPARPSPTPSSSPGASDPGPRPRASASHAVPLEPAVDTTLRRPPALAGEVGDSAHPDTHRPPRRRALPYLVAGAVVVVLLGVGGLVFALSPAGSPAQQSADDAEQASSAPVDEIAVETVAAPAELTGALSPAGDSVEFTWTNPDPRDGDTYSWAQTTATETGQASRTDQPMAVLPTTAGAPVCIEVVVVRGDGRASEPARGCAP